MVCSSKFLETWIAIIVSIGISPSSYYFILTIARAAADKKTYLHYFSSLLFETHVQSTFLFQLWQEVVDVNNQ
jgi:hypothetical protein